MPATPARVAFIKQEFRYDLREDATIAAKFTTARETEIETSFSSDPVTIDTAQFDLLKVPRSLFEVEIDGIVDLDFSRTTPTVRLILDRYGLEAGKDFIVAAIKLDYAQEKTVLRLWG